MSEMSGINVGMSKINDEMSEWTKRGSELVVVIAFYWRWGKWLGNRTYPLLTYVRVRVSDGARVSLILTLTKLCSNKIGTFVLNDKMGRLFKKWGDFLQFFMLDICLSLKIELWRTFLTYNSCSFAFQKTFSLQPSTSFLQQWRLVGIECSTARASVHVTGLRRVLVTGVKGSEWERKGCKSLVLCG